MSARIPRIAIMGGGPAGLMAAEQARLAGAEVDLYDWLGSVGRKILIAGKGGLNLTHSEPRSRFLDRYGPARARVAQWLDAFDADALIAWVHGLGVATMVGTSGRVFPSDLKAAPLLRGWVRRLREQGVRMHMHHRCVGRDANGRWLLERDDGSQATVQADACVLAFGGASWPRLGSDARWVPWLSALGVNVDAFEASNSGFECAFSTLMIERTQGQAIKNVVATVDRGDGERTQRRGELMLTAYGVEGSLVYALSAALRAQLGQAREAWLELDLAPDRSAEQIHERLERRKPGQTLSRRVRDAAGIDATKLALLYECAMDAMKSQQTDAIVHALKHLRLRLTGTRPIAEAISSAGGVRLEDLNAQLMLTSLPGVFCAGEMINWDAPTGGYLLTACLASGVVAGRGAVEFARAHPARLDVESAA